MVSFSWAELHFIALSRIVISVNFLALAMAEPYDELIANLRGLAMASPDRLPLYDTTPSNKTTASSHPNPRKGSTVGTATFFRSTPSSSERFYSYDSIPKAPTPLSTSRKTISILSSRVESLHALSQSSAQKSPVPASSRRATSIVNQKLSAPPVRVQGQNSVMQNVAHIQSVTPLATKSRVPVPKIRINSPFSLTALHGLLSSLGSEKRLLLDCIGLGGLLKVQTQRLQGRSLLVYLLRNMDPITGTINLKNGVLTMNDRDVNLVFGLPYRGQEVLLSSRCPRVVPKLKDLLGLDNDSDITIESVHSVLVREYGRKMSCKERDAFKVAAMIYVDSCFLGPRGCKRTINKDILEHLADPSEISKVNWSGYVLKVLKSSAYKVQQSLIAANKTVLVEGCLLFLLVFYLDNLNFGYMTPRHDILPRVASYTPRLLSELLSYDRVSRPSLETLQYGRSRIRSCEEVVYSRRNGKDSVTTTPDDVFGERNIPPNLHASGGQTSAGLQEDGHTALLEDQATLEEFLNDFTTQIHRSTDELRRKLVILVSNSRQCASPAPATGSPKGVNENDSTGGDCVNIGVHASQSKRYVTIISSSSSSSKHYDSANPHVSSDLDHQGSQCQSTTQAEQTVRFASNQEQTDYAFPCSPFDLKLKDKEIPVKVIIEVISLLSKISDADCNMMWYIHDAPTKLEVSGASLYSALYKEEEFSIDTMTAVMRLYQELDDALYQGLSERRWRHYLPPQWMEIAMMGEKAFVTDDIIRMFAGNLINYKVNECALVIVPIYTASNWSLYSWDFNRRTITIIDPVENSMENMVAKHDSTVCALHDAMLLCKQRILGCSDMHSMKWFHNYAIDQDACCNTTRSGLYTAFYARFFDGLTCRRVMLMDDSVTLFQTSLLCRLLGSNSNKASYPPAIRRAIAGLF